MMYREDNNKASVGKDEIDDKLGSFPPTSNHRRSSEHSHNPHIIRTMSMPASARRLSPTTNGIVNGNGEIRSRATPDEAEARQRLHCKYGFHLAVPMGKKDPGDVASSTSTPHVIAMVGLPARGKTYISKKLSRYLNWIGVNTRVFNLGDYRRKMESKYSNHELFNPANEAGLALREKVCDEGLKDVLNWLETDDGEVAVFDATNTTKARRKLLYEKVVKEKGFKLFFVESICNDESIIDANIMAVKVNSPDYKDFEKDEVLTDFKNRIEHYARQYETISESEEPDLSWMKIYDTGRKVEVHKHEGHIQARIVYYLMNVHITPRTIYLTRHGETFNNVLGRLGGDSSLTPRGELFALRLAEFANNLDHPCKVWTSWLSRTIETAKHIKLPQERWKTLNEIDSGICDDMTYEEIIEKMPDEFERRDKDKFRYRYPRGESYEDLVARLEPVIMEMERQDSLLVIGHQAVNRCILAYYTELSEDDLPWLDIPMHQVMRLTPQAYGCKAEYVDLGEHVSAVSTYRSKPVQPGVLEPKFKRNERASIEDMRGIEGLFEKLKLEAEKNRAENHPSKELGLSSSDDDDEDKKKAMSRKSSKADTNVNGDQTNPSASVSSQK